MNIKPVLSLILIAAFGFISCKKELEPQDSTPITPATAETQKAVQQPPQMPQQMPQQTAQTPAVVSQTPAVTVKPAPVPKGMNPAHGQPGHRCDIAVGAPLNSPAPKPAPATITSTQQIKAGQNTPQTPAILNPGTPAPDVVTAPGMNPPHGQEGHKCEVAVGAPLPK